MSRIETRVAVQRIAAVLMITATILATAGIFENRGIIHELQLRHDRLSGDYGRYLDFDLRDNAKIKLARMPQPDPQLFRWRVHQPDLTWARIEGRIGFAACQQKITDPNLFSIGDGGSAWNDQFQLDFQLDAEQSIVHYAGTLDATSWQIRDPLIVDLLRNHWDELEFEIAADSDIVTIPATENCTLLRIRAPRHLLTDARFAENPEGTFVWFRFGSQRAFQREAEAQQRENAP